MLEYLPNVHVLVLKTVAHDVDEDDIGHPLLDRSFHIAVGDQSTVHEAAATDFDRRPKPWDGGRREDAGEHRTVRQHDTTTVIGFGCDQREWYLGCLDSCAVND
ncbi:MAG TPA: hypothetical protein VFR33_14890 [Candidatus Dormibacteraeota bacterium]|nr:hypothetical protein [Candidatus Dormibacteraeota bacterium]